MFQSCLERTTPVFLHLCFPFTNALKFDPNRIWADPDHQTLTKPCFKAGRNLFGPSIIEGHNPKKNKPNYWCTGMKDGTIIPYNLKLKLGMTLKGRPNHQCTGQEKARVAAMYRECELRGIGFKKPKWVQNHRCRSGSTVLQYRSSVVYDNAGLLNEKYCYLLLLPVMKKTLPHFIKS